MSFKAVAHFLVAASIFAVTQASQTPLSGTSHTQPRRSAAGAKKKAGPTTGEPTAIFHTTAGKLTCKLYPKQAPKTVENFIGLATGKKDWTDPKTQQTKHGIPLYDGTIFHRVIPSFMIQGGDPLGIGMGGPGYSFEDEFSPELRFDKPGILAMANSGPGTNGSQFFITEVPTPHLNDHHTIFGQCDDSSVELVKKIARVPRDDHDRPLEAVKINHISITGAGAKAAARRSGTPGSTRKKTPSTKLKANPQTQNQ